MYFGEAIGGGGPAEIYDVQAPPAYIDKWIIRRPLAFGLVVYDWFSWRALRRDWPVHLEARLAGGVAGGGSAGGIMIVYLLLVSAGSEATARVARPAAAAAGRIRRRRGGGHHPVRSGGRPDRKKTASLG
jgi:hypothetical protein